MKSEQPKGVSTIRLNPEFLGEDVQDYFARREAMDPDLKRATEIERERIERQRIAKMRQLAK